MYSFEGDSTPTGDGNLIQKIADLCGFEKDYASILANITFQEDYGSLSTKTIRKILPHLKMEISMMLLVNMQGINIQNPH